MTRPNIIFILMDDMGYGDPSCYNPEGKIQTPCMDEMASGGMRFTDAHAPTSVCTPSRYGILTGRYAWRGRLQRGVLGPYDPPLIEDNLLTWSQFLRDEGYHTACFGKWHLGMAWPFRERGMDPGAFGWHDRVEIGRNVDYGQPVAGGPIDRGFDTYFGVDVPNFPPYCFIEQNRTVGVPDRDKPDSMYGAAGTMLEGWDLQAIMPELTRRVVAHIRERAAHPDPFFIYFPMTGPHTPIVPTVEWRGKSAAGIYGDWVMQLDDSVGQVNAALRRAGVADNTLVVVTSDNGSPNRDGQSAKPGTCFEHYGHNSSGPLRGMKGDSWEGGHRVPFIATWPTNIPPGTVCDELICLLDMMATTSGILGVDLPDGAAQDSVDISPYLLGDGGTGPLRTEIVHHGLSGLYGYRRGFWKLIDGRGSGGFSPDPPTSIYDPPGQLYDLAADLGERHNFYFSQRDRVCALSEALAQARCVPTSHRGMLRTFALSE